MWVYPNPGLDAALERAAATRLVACQGHYATVAGNVPFARQRGHLAYGAPTVHRKAVRHAAGQDDDDAADAKADAAFEALPLYDSGKNCVPMALIAALRPGSAHRAATPAEADIFMYFPHHYIAPLVEQYTARDRLFLDRAKFEETLTGEERLRLRGFCDFLWRLDANATRRLMPHLGKRNFRRHFIIAGDAAGDADAHACAAEGRRSPPLRPEWSARPLPFLARLLSFAFDPENAGAAWVRKLHVPWVGPLHRVHPHAGAAHAALFAHARRHRVSFVGSTRGTPENAALRAALKAACLAAAGGGGGPADDRACIALPPQNTSAGNLRVKFKSTFCLEPNGFGDVRKSAVDALQMGCIPVFFLRRARFELVWPAHWRAWRRLAAVNVDVLALKRQAPLSDIVHPASLVSGGGAAAAALQGALRGGGGGGGATSVMRHVLAFLAAVPAATVAAMQRALARHVHTITYGFGTRRREGEQGDDAVARILAALRDTARAQAACDRARRANVRGARFPRWPARLNGTAWLRWLERAPEREELLLMPHGPGCKEDRSS